MADTPSEDRAARAANLFDLRRIIGGLFTVWGVLLIILGATDSDAEANKAAGININLFAGIGMLIFGLAVRRLGAHAPARRAARLRGRRRGDRG